MVDMHNVGEEFVPNVYQT